MSSLELLRRIVRQQTDHIGQKVSNLYGSAPRTSSDTVPIGTTSWLLVTLGNNQAYELDAFYVALAGSETSTTTTLPATSGVASTQLSTSDGVAKSFLLHGTINAAGSLLIPLDIVTNQAQSNLAVYVDGVLQRRGTQELSLNLSITAGNHVIDIVGAAPVVAVSVPASVQISSNYETLVAPIWNAITSSYIDPKIGTSSATLSWYNDAKVGGWGVYRRTVNPLGTLAGIGGTNNNRQYSLIFSGDLTSTLSKGQDLLIGSSPIGQVQSSYYDGTLTQIVMQLPDFLTATNSIWQNQTVLYGAWVHITDVKRSTISNSVSWVDSSVVYGQMYQYALRAYGLFDPTQLSDFGNVQTVVIGDTTAPASITFAANYPAVSSQNVVVKFHTPSDSDYAGVKVFYKNSQSTGTSSGSNTATTLNDTTKNWPTNIFVNSIVTITAGTGLGQQGTITANTGTQVTINSANPWVNIPDATSTYEILTLTQVVTDYGIPNTDDELTFRTIGEGTYYFCTFDQVLNLQPLLVCTNWVYAVTNETPIPVTNISVTNKSVTGRTDSNTLGVTIYSIPPVTPILSDTFDVGDGTKFGLQSSRTADGGGNTTTTIVSTGAGWSVNAFVFKWVRITSAGVLQGRQSRILSNTATTLTLETALPLPPNGVTFQVWDQVPDIIPLTVLGGGAGSDNWQLTDTTTVLVLDGAATFIGPKGKLHDMYLDSTLSTGFRYEAVVNRGGTGHFSGSQFTGSNLTYRANSSNTNRWEYGVLHSSDTTVTLRYRYNSGGAGAWTTLMSGYAWNVRTPMKMIVELDGNIHSFRLADAFGGNELLIGRTTDPSGSNPPQTKIGWDVRGNSGDDWIDELKVINFNNLTRIKYSLTPDDDELMVVHEVSTATSGSTTSLFDTTNQWYVNEFKNYRVLITSGPAVGNDRLIVSNSVNAIVPDTAFTAAITNGTAYTIYATQYEGTERAQFWAHTDPLTQKAVRFHGERALVASEVEQRVLIEANDIAELAMTVIKTADNPNTTATVSVQIVPDPDVKTWEFYMKKGAWPTLDGTTSGILDPRYRRLREGVAVTQQSLQVGYGNWYCAALGYDSNGTSGPAIFQSIVLSNGIGNSTALSNLNAIVSAGKVVVSWNHTSDVEFPLTTAKLNITATVKGVVDSAIINSSYDIWNDGGGTHTIPGYGTFTDTSAIVGLKGADPLMLVTYKLDLSVSGVYITSYYALISYYGRYLL